MVQGVCVVAQKPYEQEVARVSCIDVEHRADGVSLTLAAHGFSFNVELSQSEADELIEQLTMQPSGPTGSDCQPPSEPARDSTRVGC